MTQIDI